jgi:RNA polymerase sigma factor (sigma-70 family)
MMPDDLINGIDVTDFLPLAHSIAIAFHRSGTPDVDELCSIAQSALMRAAEGYRPSKGAFSPYAGTVVRNAMLTEIRRRKGTGSQVPVDFLDFDPKAVAAETEHLFPTPPDGAASDSDREWVLLKVLGALDARSQQALWFLAEGDSLSEIGKKLGVSKTMAHKIVSSALGNVREALRQLGIESRYLCSQPAGGTTQSRPTIPTIGFDFDQWTHRVRTGSTKKHHQGLQSWLKRLWTGAAQNS